MVVVVFDMNNINFWIRFFFSEFIFLEGVKNWVRRFVKSFKNVFLVFKKFFRVIIKILRYVKCCDILFVYFLS